MFKNAILAIFIVFLQKLDVLLPTDVVVLI